MKPLVAGLIVSVVPHPSADNLRICQVEVGEDVIRVVTNAADVEEGLTVAVAVRERGVRA